MRYMVVRKRFDEAVVASAPGPPGRRSQDQTEAETMENIRVAIRESLAVVAEQSRDAEVAGVGDGAVPKVPRVSQI